MTDQTFTDAVATLRASYENANARDIGKRKALLDALVRVDDRVMTKRVMIEALVAEGRTLTRETRPKYRYDRIKYNRMDYREQAAYEKKLKETVTKWIAMRPDGETWVELTTTEAAYFLAIGGQVHLQGDIET